MANLALVFDVLAKDNASKTFRDVGNSAERAGKQTSMFGDLTSRAVKSAGAAVAAFGIASVFKDAIGAASDLNETVNKTNVIFGSNSGAIQKWARGSATNFGLSRQAALEAASGFGNMLTQLGYTGDAALEASTGTVKLAADLGSFNNLDTGDVLDRIGAALRGEYDSLQLLIPNINAARVEQEAMAETGKTSAKQLTAQEKATATLAIVQRDGVAAADDFAETSDGLANATKITAARFEDLQAQIGQGFLPVAEGAMHFLSDTAIPAVSGLATGVADLAGWFGDLPAPLQAAAGAAAVWAIAGDNILGGFGKIKGAVSPLRGAMSSFSEALGYARANGDGLGTVLKSVGSYAGGQTLTAIRRLGRAIGPELAVAGAAFVVTDLVKGFQELTGASDEAKAAAEGLAHALTLTDDVADRHTIRKVIEDTDGLVDALGRAGVSGQDAINGLLGQEDAQRRVTGALQEYINVRPGGIHNEEATGALTAKHAYDELATGYGTAAGNARFFSDEATNAKKGAEETGAAAEASVPQIDEAADAIKKWREQLQQVGSSFVEPLSIYTGLLQEAAQKTADSTKSSTDSWSDYAADASVSLDTFAQKLQDQITAQENWRANLVAISARGGAEVAQILADMGVEGAGYVQQMVDANGEDFAKMRDLMIRDANLGGAGAAAALDTQMKIAARVGAAGAKDTVVGIAKELNVGVGAVESIASQYGIKLASGINPLLGALGRGQLSINSIKRGHNSIGGYADGGYTGPGGKYTPAGIVHAGEFVFPQESVKRLGVNFLGAMAGLPGYAGGGFVSPSDVPRPSSTAPYRMPISTAGNATMQKGFDEVRRWLEANQEPAYTGGSATAGAGALVSFGRWLQSQGARVSEHPAFGGVTMGAHVRGSKHYQNKAIDVNTRPGTSALEQRELDPLMAAARAAGFQVIWRAAGHFNHGHVASYGDGTNYVPETGYAMLHKGEAVVPASKNQGAPYQAGPVEITGTLRIDGDGLARIVDGRIVAHDTRQSIDSRSWR